MKKVAALFPFHTRVFFVYLLLLLVAMNQHLQAAIVIDDFTTPQTVAPGSNGSVTGSGIMGDEREVATGDYCNVEVVNQTFHGYNNFSTHSNIRLKYNGSSTGDGETEELALDLTGYTGFEITFLNTTGINTMYIDVMNKTPQSRDLYSVFFYSPSSPMTLFIPFTDFYEVVPATPVISTASQTTTDAVNFTNVEYIRFYITLDAGNSCEIDSIAIVPEPATLILLSLGGLMLRRQQSKTIIK